MTRRFISLLPFLALLVALATVPAAAADPPGGARLLAKLPGPAGTDAAFSRDGKLLLTAGGDEARVWDAETYKPVTKPLKHEDGEKLFLAVLGPDGKQVLTAAGSEAWVWDAATGNPLHTLRHGGEIRCAAFSPAGDRVATGGRNSLTRVWDLAAGGKQSLEVRHDGGTTCGFVAISPGGGSTLLTVEGKGGEGGRLRGWDTATGRELWHGHLGVIAENSHPTWSAPAAFSADGTKVAWLPFAAVIISDARSWDGDAGTWRGFDRRYLEGVAFGPDGRTLLVTTDHALLLDATRRDLPTFRVLQSEAVWHASFSADGRRVVTSAGRDRTSVWDVATGNRIAAIPPRVLYDDAQKPVGTRVIRSDGRPVFAYEVPAVALSPDGKRLAAGFASDGFTSIWEVPNHKQP